MIDDALIIVENFEVVFDIEAISAKMSARKPSAKALGILEALAVEAQAVARPVAGGRVSTVSIVSDDQVKLDHKLFESALLRKKLEGHQEAIAYVASEGEAIAKWAQTLNSTERIFADLLEREALMQARLKLQEAILEKLGIEQISAMNPGSLRIWPITEQVPLFDLLDPLPKRLGVSVLPSYMMEPRHTVSGVYFQTDSEYHNCQLCEKADCPSREVPYTGMD